MNSGHEYQQIEILPTNPPQLRIGQTIIRPTQPPQFVPDKDYDLVPPRKERKKGIQCGTCGMKFDTGKTYGYVCSRPNCPVFPQITC